MGTPFYQVEIRQICPIEDAGSCFACDDRHACHCRATYWDCQVIHSFSTFEKATQWCIENAPSYEKHDPKRFWWFAILRDWIDPDDTVFDETAPDLIGTFDWNGNNLYGNQPTGGIEDLAQLLESLNVERDVVEAYNERMRGESS